MLTVHTGHLQGNQKQWKFFKNTNFDFIQIYKILHSVQHNWSILGWSDCVWGTEIWAKWYIFSFFANFNQFQEIVSCWHFRRPKDIVMFFPHPQTSYFMLIIKFVPGGIKKILRNCKNMLKGVFRNSFFAKY